MNKVQIVIAAIQIVLLIAALVLLAVNKHESFQDFMIMTIFIGYIAGSSAFKGSDEEG